MAVPAAAQERPAWFSGAIPAIPGTGAWPPTPPAGAPAPQPSTPAAAAGSPLAGVATRANLRHADNIFILIRTSLLTLNDAMLTGNFTVMRDKVAPSVREQNSPGRLYQTFSRLIEQKIDLRAVAILAPEMSEVPVVDAAGRLNLKGSFRAPDGTALMFHLVFESVNGQWLLYGAAVNTVTAVAAAGAASQARASTAPVSATSNKRGGPNPRPATTKGAN